jgi:hypothetical protein
MRTKLKLNLEELTVDSFDTADRAAENGTVFAEQCTCWTNCTCPGCPTCDASCNGTCAGQYTCDASCNGTCNCGTQDWTCGPRCGQTALYTACEGVQCY